MVFDGVWYSKILAVVELSNAIVHLVQALSCAAGVGGAHAIVSSGSADSVGGLQQC